jgi:hypothetical protein
MLSSLSRPALGEIWSSAMGGGLGSLGELDGEAIGCFQSALICSGLLRRKRKAVFLLSGR